MTQSAPAVTFYLTGDDYRDGRLRLACRLAETAYRHGHKVYIHTPNQRVAEDLDRLLWTFADGSFVPHKVAAKQSDEGVDDYPVVIGAEEPDKSHDDVLIPLLEGVPAYFQRFTRVMEAVDSEATEKQQARARFKAYRDLGIEPETHNL